MKGITARVTYRKSCLAKFIGHLDTVRVLQRSIRRAGIDAVYSQGFSPRPRLSFSVSLPLGFTSECEFFDIRLANTFDPRTFESECIRRDLQAHLPEGFSVQEVRILEGKPPPLERAFWAAAYEIELPPGLDVRRDGRGRFGTCHEACPATASAESAVTGPEGTPRVVRASQRDRENGSLVFSLVLRQDLPGKGGVKQAICDALAIDRETLVRCRIHKKRVYENGESV